jgi:hypothetical protein
MTTKTKPIYIPLIRRTDAVIKARRRNGDPKQKRTTLSAELFNDGKKLDRLIEGGEVYHSVYVEVEAKIAAIERDLGLVN